MSDDTDAANPPNVLGVTLALEGIEGAGDKLIAEIAEHEGVFVPRNVPYWFESVGDELLELLQVEAIDKTVKNKLTRHAPKKVLSMQVFKPEGEVIGVAGQQE